MEKVVVNNKTFVMVAMRQEELGQFSVLLPEDQCELSTDPTKNVFFVALVSEEMIQSILKCRKGDDEH